MKPQALLPVVLAVIAVGVAGTLYFRARQSGTVLQQQLDQTRAQAGTLAAQVADLTQRNVVLQTQVTELDANLGETKTKLTVSDAHNVQLSRELSRLKSRLAAHEQDTEALNREIAGLKQELATARASTSSTENVAAYQATIADLEQRLARSAAAATPSPPVPEPPPAAVLTTHRSRNASVMSVGPSSAFVVVNYGAAHGALPGQQLLIRRGTENLAQVLISDVRENHSIAQVQPDSLRGALHKGDLALLTE